MFPPFDTELALHFGRVLAKKIDSGEYRLIPKTKPSMERMNQGVMLGVLVCNDEDGNRRLLACSSGIHWEVCKASREPENQDDLFTFVPPVVSASSIEEALAQNDAEIHRLTEEINALKSQEHHEKVAILKARRSSLTTESLSRVHELYQFHTITGTVFTLKDLITQKGELPPTGIGDCCEIKLLDYAFCRRWQPLSMAQVYYEKGQVSSFVPPCDSRCSWLLPKMLGLNIVYQDDHICVINKQSGLLSVPGRSQENKDCAESRLALLYPGVIVQSAVHRLDMETSGLLVLAKTAQAHRNLRMQFENKTVEKRYSALLGGILEKSTGQSSPKKGEKSGLVTLPFRLDVENRPYQVYDEKDGLPGTTEWINEGVEIYTRPDGTKIKATRMTYIPKTGRTHQLRLLSADAHGFNLPIIGDSLYGKKEDGEDLQLTSCYIKIRHPVSGVEMEWSLPVK